jgi:hypothetical protein
MWTCLIAATMPVALTSASEAQAPKDKPVVLLDQGWTPEVMRAWYWTPQGSQLIPYDWFLALEQVDNARPFQADEVIDRFRYLPEGPGPGNPDGLPIGFARGEDEKGRAWLGFTCAACHTGQVDYKGTRIRIEGAPTLGDLAPLRDEMIAAVKATLDDRAKFGRFAARVLGPNAPAGKADALREEVHTFAEGMVTLADRSRPKYPEGFGRVDAFTILMNEMLGTVAGEPANYRTPAAPVSYPFLWNAPMLEWVQWNGAVQNAIARNDGEVLIVFGHAEATPKDNDVLIRSTGKIRNLNDLEEWTRTLTPPRWPGEILGPVDAALARRGGEVYRKAGCAECHADRPPYPESAPNKFGKRFIKVARTPLKELGTDAMMAEGFLSRTAKTGKFAVLFGGAKEIPAWQMVYMGLVKLVQGDLPAAGLSPQQMIAFGGFREDVIPTKEDLTGYKTGPLAGIWATAPYLHNGSVPSLYQLLLPPKDRVKVFHVGSREFDPREVGYRSGPTPGSFEFRTDIPGNFNTGHEYGTNLSEPERWALVEYLKTL